MNLLRHRIVFVLLWLALVPAAAGAAAPAGITDVLDIAAKGAEAAHSFRSHGSSARVIAGGMVGGHDTRRAARQVAGEGSWVEYRLRVGKGAPVTLEIEELDGRETGVRGYSVLADGKPVAFRSWRMCGAGPVHWFVELPPRSGDTVTLRLVNAGGAPFRVSRIWAYAHFDSFFQKNGLDVPYYVAPLVGLDWHDAAKDLGGVRKVRASMPPDTPARPAFTAAIPYAALDDAEIQRRVAYVLDLARRADMPVQIALDTWWGSTPDGSDGRGGFWTDVAYQQVVYNATARRYQLSVPNQWSSTPWLTVDHPDLNAFKRARLAVAARAVRDATADLRAEGRGGLLLAVNLDNEPVYWASGNAGLGGDLLEADFNEEAVARAKRAGVTLDPTDGLSRAERLWLFRNLLGYNAMIAGNAAKALGHAVTLVSGGKAYPDADPPSANIYSQAMTADPALQYPMLDAAWPLWETAAPGAARVGGEWNGSSLAERQAILHQLALGRSAGTNAEAGNDAANMQGVRPGYALGQRFLALYNYPLDRMDSAVSELRDRHASWTPLVFLPVRHEEHFRTSAWKSRVASFSGIQTGVIGNTAAIAAFPASAEDPGVLTLRLTAPEGGWDGLYLELNGRARNFEKEDPDVRLRVLAGPAPDALREIHVFHDAGSITDADRVDLSTLAPGHHPVYVRIELHAPGLRPDLLRWCAVWSVHFTTPWPGVPRALLAAPVSLMEARRRNLLVSWRADAEGALSELAAGAPASAALTKARAAFARGAYADAVRIANEALGTTLPAVYRVADRGPLEPWPLRLEADRPLTAVVEESGGKRVALRLLPDAETTVNIQLTGRKPGVRYAVVMDGGRWTAVEDPRGSVTADPRGVLRWAGKVAPPAPRARLVHGAFRGVEAAGMLGIFPDAGGRIAVAADAHTVYRRSPEGEAPADAGLSDFLRGDEVVVRVAADGRAVEVTGSYQIVEGAVRSFQPLSPWKMPSVALADGESHIIDLYAPLHLSGEPVSLRALPVATAALRPGDTVRLRLNPKTGRAFEVWRLRTSG